MTNTASLGWLDDSLRDKQRSRETFDPLADSLVRLQEALTDAAVQALPAFLVELERLRAFAWTKLSPPPLKGSAQAVPHDGSGALVDGIRRERKDYGHVAVTAKVAINRPHGGRAFERFTDEGPMALLPEGEDYGVVWTMTPERAQETLALGDNAFLDALAARFGPRFEGRMSPLVSVRADCPK